MWTYIECLYSWADGMKQWMCSGTEHPYGTYAQYLVWMAICEEADRLSSQTPWHP